VCVLAVGVCASDHCVCALLRELGVCCVCIWYVCVSALRLKQQGVVVCVSDVCMRVCVSAVYACLVCDCVSTLWVCGCVCLWCMCVSYVGRLCLLCAAVCVCVSVSVVCVSAVCVCVYVSPVCVNLVNKITLNIVALSFLLTMCRFGSNASRHFQTNITA